MTHEKDLVHWPVLALTGTLAGFAIAGLIGLGWALTRPEHVPQVRILVQPQTVEVANAEIVASEAIAFTPAEEKPAGPDSETAFSRPLAPDMTDEPVAAYKKAVADPAPPVPAPAEEKQAARLIAQLAEEEPAAGCGLHGTTVRFARSMTVAVKEAQERDKLLMVMHISGHFEDAAFT